MSLASDATDRTPGDNATPVKCDLSLVKVHAKQQLQQKHEQQRQQVEQPPPNRDRSKPPN
jgi:hypothetical protein